MWPFDVLIPLLLIKSAYLNLINDECELVSVYRQVGRFTQHKVAAIRLVQLRVLFCTGNLFIRADLQVLNLDRSEIDLQGT